MPAPNFPKFSNREISALSEAVKNYLALPTEPEYGGTGTRTPPTAGQVLIGTKQGKYVPAKLTAGANVTISFGDGSITIASSGGGGGGGLGDPGSNGIVVRTALNTTAARTLTAGSSKLSITNADGTGGNPTIDVAPANIDHGALGGLSDDDHSIYALLAGRAGGQSLTGGTGAGENLNLLSTTNPTTGKINLGTASTYDQLNDRLGIGNTAPSYPLHVMRSMTSGPMAGFNRTHTSPSGADPGDNAIEAVNTISASSASNHLAIRGVRAWATNNLTGGGVTSFLRAFEAVTNNDAAGANTTSAEALSIYGLNSGSGTISSGYGVRINALAGTNLFGVADDVGTLWYNNGSGAKLAIGTATPTVSAEFRGTDAVLIPKGTTGQEPAPVDGYLRYNTTTGKLRAVQGGSWTDVIGGGSSGLSQQQVMAIGSLQI